MKGTAPKSDLEHFIKLIDEMGYQSHIIWDTQRTVIGAVGDEKGKARLHSLEALPNVGASFPFSSRSS